MSTEITRTGFSPQAAMPLTGAKPPAADVAQTKGSLTPTGTDRLATSDAAARPVAAAANRLQTTQAEQQSAQENARSTQEQQAELQDALERLNKHMRDNARAIEFSIDDVTNRTIITVRQRDTGEVIRQIPSDGLIEFAHQVEEQLKDAKGMLWNSKT